MDSSSEVGEGKVGVTTLFVENIPGLTVKMAKDQRARRSVPEYSPNADRFRKDVSRETGNEKMRGPQRPIKEPRRKRIAGHVENEDFWSMRSRSIWEEGLGGSSKEETADCGNQNEEGNKENGVENVLGVEIKEEGCIVASEFRVDPKPVANLNKFGKNPFGETHQTWASRLINSGVEVLDSKLERVGDEVRTQKGIQFGPENLVENMIEALDLARCGQTSKRVVIQLKTDKVSSDLGKQVWANRVNESFNAEKGFSTSDVEVA
ncbi:hypothetical protein V6N12_010438 [Hibiscus sabdariffa]|uniref:Uncharacterized protein n=1 Tax=Hibiscus sabdariffa TaxID=183260 RepID=A0ABR2ELR5_9ROSI